MHDPPFLGAHRVHLDGDVAVQSLLGSTIGAGGEHLPSTLSVARCVEHDPLAVTQATEGGLEAKELERIDRLPALADQQPKVVIAGNDGLNPLIVLPNLNLTIKVKLVENPLNKLPNPLRRLLRPFGGVAHA